VVAVRTLMVIALEFRYVDGNLARLGLAIRMPAAFPPEVPESKHDGDGNPKQKGNDCREFHRSCLMLDRVRQLFREFEHGENRRKRRSEKKSDGFGIEEDF